MAEWYRERLAKTDLEAIAEEINYYRKDINKKIKASERYNEAEDTYTYSYNGKEFVSDFEFTPDNMRRADWEVSEGLITDTEIVKKFGLEDTGQLYRVEIPDENYLLWDKPLSEQPQAVQDALAAIDPRIQEVKKIREDYINSLPPEAKPIAERMFSDDSKNLTNGTTFFSGSFFLLGNFISSSLPI